MCTLGTLTVVWFLSSQSSKQGGYSLSEPLCRHRSESEFNREIFLRTPMLICRVFITLSVCLHCNLIHITRVYSLTCVCIQIPVLDYCWDSIADGGSTLNQHWSNDYASWRSSCDPYSIGQFKWPKNPSVCKLFNNNQFCVLAEYNSMI